LPNTVKNTIIDRFSKAAGAAFLRLNRFSKIMESALMNTYAPPPIEFTHGQGSWLYDTEGKRYLDGLSGIAVCGLGHAHPAVTEAISLQASRLLHVSNLFATAPQQQLAQTLCRLAGMTSVFFANSGAEANEAAIKMARLHGHKNGVQAPTIVVMDSAFHGRTMATLSASGNRKIQAGFEPLVSGFVRAPFGDINALKTIAQNNRQVVAVMLEPIQGESGIIVPPPGYLHAIRQLCDQHGWLMILDEIQTGNGRTGSFFNYQQESILPDIVTTAKGLGNGVPIGACLARGVAASIFQPGSHGSTFGGNPLACSAALAVLGEIEQRGLTTRAAELGDRIEQRLRQRLERSPASHLVAEIRHCGLMFGISLNGDCSHIVRTALEQGLVLNLTAGNVIRLLPPLTLSDDEADLLADRVAQVVTEHGKQNEIRAAS
jgi:acetylornithine/N-succinyldiaminopimelate aminotransferase